MKATQSEQLAFERETDSSAEDSTRPTENQTRTQTNSVHALAERIRQRIELRLPGRIRDLKVVVVDGEVELAGRCATFYSKQLAQHVAMGVIDHERLVNSIEVGL